MRPPATRSSEPTSPAARRRWLPPTRAASTQVSTHSAPTESRSPTSTRTAGISSMTKLNWVRPKASPDGRWIAYTYATSGGVGAIGFYSVQANGTPKILQPGRSGTRFLTNDLVWYIGERACATCFGGQPQATGVTYIYSIAGGSEVTSRLASVSDVWPHVTAPAL